MRALRAMAVLLALGCLGAGPQAAAELPRVLDLDVYVFASDVFAPDRRASLRVVTRAVTSLARVRPLPLAWVDVDLSGADRRQRLVARRADGLGNLEASFWMPDWPEGDYRMTVTVRSPLGRAQQRRDVRILRRGRVLLLRNQACYRPGETVELRALVLENQLLRPIDGAPVRFAILDPGDQVVASREQACDSDGIARASFSLPAGSPPGAYRTVVSAVRADTFESVTARMPVGRVEGLADGGSGTPEAADARAFEPEGRDLELRTDKAVYSLGERLRISLAARNGEGICYLDLVKDGQTLLTRSTVLQAGRADLRLAPGPEVFGRLELRAYRISDAGHFVGVARQVSVQQPNGLNLEVARDQPVYRPGQQARFRFQVTDRLGRGKAAALAVIVLDAIAPLPGRARQAAEWSSNGLPPQWAAWPAAVESARGQPLAASWLWRDPALERRRAAEKDRAAIAEALEQACAGGPCASRQPGGWVYQPDLFERLLKEGLLGPQHARDPLGERYTLDGVERFWPDLGADRVVGALELERLWRLRQAWMAELTERVGGLDRLRSGSVAKQRRLAFLALVRKWPDARTRDPAGKTYHWKRLRRLPGFRARDVVRAAQAGSVQALYRALGRYGQQNQRWYRVSVLDPVLDAYRLPDDILSRLVQRELLAQADTRDFWGRTFRVRRRAQPATGDQVDSRLRFYEIISRGADGCWDTADDLVYPTPAAEDGRRALALELTGASPAANGARGGRPAAGPPPSVLQAESMPIACPRTVCFAPALATDARGLAELKVALPASAGTWRVLALANAPDGGLGFVEHTLRVAPGDR